MDILYMCGWYELCDVMMYTFVITVDAAVCRLSAVPNNTLNKSGSWNCVLSLIFVHVNQIMGIDNNIHSHVFEVLVPES